ncbi:MAG: hypothetical protein ACREOQ_03350 [Gemmatimonadales bacterium]
MADDQGGKFLGIVSSISALLLAWIGYTATRQKDAQDQAARNSQAALDRITEERQRTTGERDVNLKVYELVVSALQDSSRRRQEIARSLVFAMVTDSSLQRGFLEALQAQGVPSIQQVVANDISFDDATRQARAAASLLPASGGGSSRVDLFWCESSGRTAKDFMQAVQAALRSAGFAESGVRVRALPATVNTRPGYHVAGYQVRYEPGEQNEAAKVREAMGAAIRGGGPESVTMRLTTTPTPGYISAFACQ